MGKIDRKLKKVERELRELCTVDCVEDFLIHTDADEITEDDFIDDIHYESDEGYNHYSANDRDYRVTQSKVYQLVLNDKRARYCDDCGGDFYLKIVQGCYYDKLADLEMENYIAKLLTPESRSRLSTQCIRNVLGALKREPEIKFQKNEDAITYFVNIRNGVLDVRTLELLPHDFGYGFDYCLDVRYLERATLVDAPAFKGYLETSLENNEERIRLSLQTKAFIYSNVRAKKSVFYVGESNSGKSVELKLMVMMYGKEKVSNVPFHKLGNTFYLDKLRDAKINVSFELKNVKSEHLDVFKSLTGGGDLLLAEPKGGTPYFFSANVKLIFAGNVLPKIKEMELTEAFMNRVVILRFPITIPDNEQDPELLTKFMNERDVIFSLSMYELPELCRNGFTFVEPKADKMYIENFKQSLSNIETFIRDRCHVTRDGKTWTSNLYAVYQEYCNTNNFDAYSKTKFNEAMDAMPGLMRRKFRVGLSSPRYGYQGIALKSIAELMNAEIDSSNSNDAVEIENESEQERLREVIM